MNKDFNFLDICYFHNDYHKNITYVLAPIIFAFEKNSILSNGSNVIMVFILFFKLINWATYKRVSYSPSYFIDKWH